MFNFCNSWLYRSGAVRIELAESTYKIEHSYIQIEAPGRQISSDSCYKYFYYERPEYNIQYELNNGRLAVGKFYPNGYKIIYCRSATGNKITFGTDCLVNFEFFNTIIATV